MLPLSDRRRPYFESTPGLSVEDADVFFVVYGRGHLLYHGPDRETAESIADYALERFGRRPPVHVEYEPPWS